MNLGRNARAVAAPRTSAYIPVRVELLDGSGMWRGIRDLTDHGELCRAFGLDPVGTAFDLPSSARNCGSAVSGAGGSTRGGRRIHGFVLRHGEPIGKIYVAIEGERFRDSDPSNKREFLDKW